MEKLVMISLRTLFSGFGISPFLCFGLFLGTAASRLDAREFGDSIVAMVGDRAITVYELHRMSRKEEESLRNLYSGEELTQKIIALRKAVARQLVDRELLAMEFDALGAKVPAELIQDRIDRAVRRETGGNRIQFEKKLAAAGMTMGDFEERMRKEIAADLLLREKVLRHIRVAPREIREYYRTHAKELALPSRYRLEVIMLRADDKGRYAGRIDETLAEIRKKIAAGVPFADLAKQYSEDASAEAGGDRGWIEEANLNEQFRAAVASLEPGQVSPKDVRIGDKIYIVRLAEKEAGGIPPLDADLTRTIEQRLRQQQRQKRYETYLAELRQKYYVVTADDLEEKKK